MLQAPRLLATMTMYQLTKGIAMSKINRVALIVLDSAGVGALPDAKEYGDEGANTFGNLAKAAGGLSLPNMEKMGLGNIIDIQGVKPTKDLESVAYGKAAEASSGKIPLLGTGRLQGLLKKILFPPILMDFHKRSLMSLRRKQDVK